MTERIRGILAPVVTPFKADLAPDPERLVAHCRWLLSQNCGLAVFGTNSEANSLSLEERSTLLDQLIAAGIDPARMMPGTGFCSITETVRLTAQAVKHGCAGVLMLPPFYYKSVTEDGLYRYFSEVVQRVADDRLRIYLYHIPPVAVVGITPGLVERLLESYPDNIAGMKDSSGDWNNTKMFLNSFGKAGFDVFVGSETFLLANMRHGGVGAISATANVNPAAIYELYELVSREHRARSEELKGASRIQNQGSNISREEPEARQTKLNVVRETFAKYPMIAALKHAIAIYSNDPAWAKVRPPLVELTTEQANRLAAELEAISFSMPGLGKRRSAKG